MFTPKTASDPSQWCELVMADPTVGLGPVSYTTGIGQVSGPTIQFFTDRTTFKLAATQIAGLIVSDFNTMPSNVYRSSQLFSKSDPPPNTNTATQLSLSLSFSHVRSGLPFDFALQRGLVRVNAIRRLEEAIAPSLVQALRRSSAGNASTRRLAIGSNRKNAMLTAPIWPTGWPTLTSVDADAAPLEIAPLEIAPREIASGNATGRALRTRRNAMRFEVREIRHKKRRARRSRDESAPASVADAAATAFPPPTAPPTARTRHGASLLRVGASLAVDASGRVDQIRFKPLRPLRPRPHRPPEAPAAAAAAPVPAASTDASDGDTGVGEGNGGDDFTFCFPRSAVDLYRVYASGFRILNSDECLSDCLL